MSTNLRSFMPALCMTLMGCMATTSFSPKAAKPPTPSPAPIMNIEEVVPHLKRLALQKDLRELSILVPANFSGFYANAWWFHSHAGQIGLSLTEEEISALGVKRLEILGYLAPNVSRRALEQWEDNKGTSNQSKGDDPLSRFNPDQIDKLPSDKDPRYGKDYPEISGPLLEATYKAGLYRLLKAIPRDLWDLIKIEQIVQDAKDDRDTRMVLTIREWPILDLTTRRNPDGSLAPIYFHYRLWPKQLQQMAVACEEQSSK